MTASCLYEGTIRHRRFGAPGHEFLYPLFMMYLDLDEMPELLDDRLLWSARRFAVARFRRSDYLGDPNIPLIEATRALVEQRTGSWPEGPVRLLTHLRYFGHCFNPVSFYYCYDPAGERVEAVVADVTNTPWGERHAYVMRPETSRPAGATMSAHFDKALHVSPFMGMDHEYEWRLAEPGQTLSVQIDSRRAGQPAFDATLSLRREEITDRALNRVLRRYPAMTLRVVAGIYFQALRLRLKGASVFGHPARPAQGCPR